MKKDHPGTLKTFEVGGQTAELYSLPQLEAQGIATISRLPVSVRILLESVLRNCDNPRRAGHLSWPTKSFSALLQRGQHKR